MRVYSFLKNIFNLSLGTLLASIIAIVFTPVLATYYSPGTYGKFAIYLGVVTIFSSLGSLRLDQAIPLPKSKKESIKLVQISVLILFISSILFGFIFSIFDVLYPSLLGITGSKLYIYILFPLSMLCFGLFNIMLNYAVKIEGYKDLSLAQVLISVFSFIIPIYFFEYEEYALLILVSIGNLLGAIYLFIKFKMFREKRSSGYLKQVYEFKNFIKYSTLESLLNNLGVHAPVFIIAFLFSEAEAGIFAYCSRLMNYPASLLVSVVNKPVLNEYVIIYNDKKDELFNQIEKYYKIYFYLVNSLVLVIPYIFSLIFTLIANDQWQESIVISKLLSPWITGLLIATPFTPLFLVLRKQKESMIFQVLLFSGRISALFFVGYLVLDLNLTILSYSILSYFIWIIITGYLLKISGYKIKKFIIDFLISLSISILFWITLRFFSII